LTTDAPLTGGGDLTTDRTLAITVGTTAGTVAAGDAVLLRAAGDYSTAANKSSIDATDRVLVEQAGGGAKARVTMESIANGLSGWRPS
jgi:hypothetical protein